MAKIIVKKTVIIINDYELGDSPKLENNFTIWDPVYHMDRYLGIHYEQETKKLYLPRGIDVYYLEQIFGELAVFDDTIDPIEKIGNVMIKYKPRDERQVEALKFMIGSGVRYRQNEYRPQLSVNLPTGAGKTYCAIATFSFEQLRCAVITSSISWLEQWKKCFLEYTDLNYREIYLVAGIGSIYRLYNKTDEELKQYKVILVSLATIRSYGEKEGWNKVSELFKRMKIGMKFYDEAHLNFNTMYMIDYFTSTKKTYYITASPARSDKDENRIFQLYFKNIPSIDLFDEEEDPHTNYIAIKYSSNPTPQDISRCRNKYGLDRNKYTDYLVKQPNYYKLLTIILDIALKKDGKTLFFIGTQNGIDTTYKWILENYPELNDDVGIFTSKVKDNKMQQLEKKIILSTTKSCGAAVDIKNLKMTVVLAEPFKSSVTTTQTFGRTRNADTLYIEAVDIGFKATDRYYYDKKNIIAKYALTHQEIKLKQDELDERYERILHERFPEPIICDFISFNKFNKFITPIYFTNQSCTPIWFA